MPSFLSLLPQSLLYSFFSPSCTLSSLFPVLFLLCRFLRSLYLSSRSLSLPFLLFDWFFCLLFFPSHSLSSLFHVLFSFCTLLLLCCLRRCPFAEPSSSRNLESVFSSSLCSFACLVSPMLTIVPPKDWDAGFLLVCVASENDRQRVSLPLSLCSGRSAGLRSLPELIYVS
ncbi:putative transmembrane protein [Toxoplasma gondii VEG]|uniref:Transmembrane protein n=1 Tax=Toxoplasma gondii (strain ATCC 50861 / VEG) TaxID=432359 RepID=V4YRI3_TOXGV|nr:putative transmembrane protein [Toxoplasma gondii VEG]